MPHVWLDLTKHTKFERRLLNAICLNFLLAVSWKITVPWNFEKAVLKFFLWGKVVAPDLSLRTRCVQKHPCFIIEWGLLHASDFQINLIFIGKALHAVYLTRKKKYSEPELSSDTAQAM